MAGWTFLLITQIATPWGLEYIHVKQLPDSGVEALFMATARGDTHALAEFLARGGDLDTVRDAQCRGIAHVATATGQKALLRWLFRHRNHAWFHDYGGQDGTPLYFALQRRDRDMVRFWTEVYMDRALHVFPEVMWGAAYVGDSMMVMGIHEAGVKNDPEALRWALEGGNLSIVNLLLSIGWTLPPPDGEKARDLLHAAVSSGNLEAVRFLERTWGRLPVEDSGWTALHVAASRGWADILERLLAYASTPDPVVFSTDLCNGTPFLYALAQGHLDAAGVLLRHGASWSPPVVSHACDGFTAIHAAVLSQKKAVVQWVLRRWKGALESKTFLGNSALHVVAREGWLEGVRFFIRKGLDPFIPGLNGETPYDVAVKNFRKDVVFFYIDSLQADPLKPLSVWTEQLLMELSRPEWIYGAPDPLKRLGLPVLASRDSADVLAKNVIHELLARVSPGATKYGEKENTALLQAYAFAGDAEGVRRVRAKLPQEAWCRAIPYAVFSGDLNALAPLLEGDCDTSSVWRKTVAHGKPEAIRKVARRFPEIVKEKKPEVLFVALGNPHPGVMNVLLDLGWSPQTRHPRSGMPILFGAVMRCHLDAVDALIRRGASLDVTHHGSTLLDAAMNGICPEGARLLLRRGARAVSASSIGSALWANWRMVRDVLRTEGMEFRKDRNYSACDAVRRMVGCMRRLLRPYCEGKG